MNSSQVLVVDDEDYVRSILLGMLEKMGFEAVEAEDVEPVGIVEVVDIVGVVGGVRMQGLVDSSGEIEYFVTW